MAWQKVCTLINRSTDSCYAGTTRHPTFQDAEPFAKFLYQLSPIADIANCAEGDPEGCAWLAANLIPTSKAAKAIGEAARSTDHAFSIGPISEKISRVLDRVDDKGAPLPGYKGGKIFKNEDGLLPGTPGVTYREWDVNPYVKGSTADRSVLSLVVMGPPTSQAITMIHSSLSEERQDG
ncbi:ribonuclease [Saccharomonospora marina XMU15]|uniref:Ribonuclease n=1 Tax=Saccharomonospora marina XMU15 TaxID=882083 RepID=H5X1V6_9PSEU|nr:ribonuclease domain-containing protein [Saccharomonospora marina]EHR52025.1 ribonuclease [Saccharomonospora marina XMU15]